MLPSAFQELLNKAAAAKQAGAFPTPTAKPTVNIANLPEAFQALLNKNTQAPATTPVSEPSPATTPTPTPQDLLSKIASSQQYAGQPFKNQPLSSAPQSTPTYTPSAAEQFKAALEAKQQTATTKSAKEEPSKAAEQEEYEKAVAQAKADYIEAMATKSPLASTSKSAYEKAVEYTPEKKAAEAKQKQIEEQQAIAAKQQAEKMEEFKKIIQAGMEKKKAQQAQKSSFLAGKNKPALLQMKSLFEKMGIPVSPQLQAAIDAEGEEEVKPVFNPFSQNPAFKDFLSYK